MRLSAHHTWVRLAALTDDRLMDIGIKYKSKLSLDDMKNLQDVFYHFGSKADLLTEWAIKSMAQYSGHTGHLSQMVKAVQFYFDAVKTPKFKSAVAEYSDLIDQDFNPKNLLDFTYWDLQQVEAFYHAPEVDPTLPRIPEGAYILFSHGDYHVVEATMVDDVCALGDSTEWCTRHEDSAKAYVAVAPLQVIFFKKKKVAQLHLGRSSDRIEFKDRKNNDLFIGNNPGIQEVLIESGLMDRVLKVLSQGVDEMKFVQFAGNNPPPYFKERCVDNANLAYMYAVATKQRFPEGEPRIAKNPSVALWYARGIIKGRFKEAEPVLLDPNFGVADEYVYFLKKHTSPEVWQEFWSEVQNREVEVP